MSNKLLSRNNPEWEKFWVSQVLSKLVLNKRSPWPEEI